MARIPVHTHEKAEVANVPIVLSLTDAEVTETVRRPSLFSGNLFVYNPRPTTQALCAAAASALERFLGPDPVTAQRRMSESEWVGRFNEAVCHLAPESMPLATAMVRDFGCDPATTFVRAPSLSGSTGNGFLAHGLGIPRHPHRDTWYAAAACQINWWVPLFDLDASASFAFHPLYWDLPVRNTSRDWDSERLEADSRLPAVTTETWLAQPRPVAPIDMLPQIRLCCRAGGVIMSSAAQLYSRVPDETTRTHFAVHFETVDERDLLSGEGASNIDAAPRGSLLSSFLRCSDMSPMPRGLIEQALNLHRCLSCRPAIL